MWISRNKYLNDTGLSKGVFRGWIDRHLVSGIHYKVIGHTTLVNPEAIDGWITQLESGHTERASESEYSRLAKSRTKKHSKVIVALDTSRQL
jgi:hypothetical protein